MRRPLAFFLLIAAAAFPLPARTDPGTDASGAEAFVEKYLETFNAADPVAMAGLYAEDGLVLPPSGGLVRGREAIQKYWSGSTRRALSFHTLQKTVCGETGFFVGSYFAREARTGRYYPASPFAFLGSKPTQVTINGNFALGVRRGGDGKWRVVSDMWTENYQSGFIYAGQGGRFVPANEAGR